MSYYGGTVTVKGRDLIANLMAGEIISLTRVVFGSGEVPAGVEPIDMEDLAHAVAEGSSTVPTVKDGVMSMTCEYRNDMNGGLENGFWIREFGVFARTNIHQDEILLYYATLGDSPQPVNRYTGDRIDTRRFPISIALTMDATVTVEYNPGAFITAEDAQEIIEVLVEQGLQDIAAAQVAFDNSQSGIAAQTVQAAIDTLVRLFGTIEEVPSPAGPLSYNGEAQSPVWQNYGADMLTIGGDTSGTAVGTYTATFTPHTGYVWSDGTASTKSVNWQIVPGIVTLPAQSGYLTYDGNPQTPTWDANYDPSALELAVTAQTNAGTYSATFTPKAGYTWGDGTTAAQTASWTIDKGIVVLPAQTGQLIYTGGPLTPEWNSDYNSAKMTLSVTAQTDIGEYPATFTPRANYAWADGGTDGRTATWRIQAAGTLTLPAQSGTLTYNGAAQSPTWDANYDSSVMDLSVTSRTNAGTYTATFTPHTGYVWSDGTTAAKVATWLISKAAGSLSIDRTTMTLDVATLTGTIAVTRDGDGAISAASSNTSVATASVSGNTVTVTSVAAGSATITVMVAEGTNHFAPGSASCAVTVEVPESTLENNSWSVIKAVSDADQGGNYWDVGDGKSVTLNGTVQGFTFSNLTVTAFIIGINHNSAKEGTHRIHFLIGKISGTDIALCDSNYNQYGSGNGFRMNKSATNSGGWNGSYMRKTVLGNDGTPSSPASGSFMAALPSDLRAVMKSVTKYTDNTGNQSNTAAAVTATTDYLFLLAEFEVFGVRSYANRYEQNSQAHYAYFSANNTDAKRVAYKHTATSTAVYWWLRSPDYGGSGGFRGVGAGGSPNGSSAYSSEGLRVGFAA